MPRLVAGGPGKRKFWRAWLDGTTLNVRFGKLGTHGQETTKSFPDEEAAAKELAKLIKQKLAKGYADNAWQLTLDDSGLDLLEVTDLVPRPEDASLAYELVDLSEDSWSGPFWHGHYTFGLSKKGETYTAGLIDRSGAGPRWRPFAPAIVGASFPSAFDSQGARFIVATAKSPAFIFDCKTLARAEVAPAGDDIQSLELTNDFAAVLRKKNKSARLELYALRDGKWSLAKTIACPRQTTTAGFGGGRGLIVGWETNDDVFDQKTQSWPDTHFLGIDKGEVRLLGTFGLGISYAFEQNGRSYFATDKVIEIRMLDEAIKKAQVVSSLT